VVLLSVRPLRNPRFSEDKGLLSSPGAGAGEPPKLDCDAAFGDSDDMAGFWCCGGEE
jgi:hypothetical protein